MYGQRPMNCSVPFNRARQGLLLREEENRSIGTLFLDIFYLKCSSSPFSIPCYRKGVGVYFNAFILEFLEMFGSLGTTNCIIIFLNKKKKRERKEERIPN